MGAQPVSLSSLATVAQWSDFHGLSRTTTYRLLQAGRLRHINVSAGTKHAAYRIDLAALPDQPDLSAASHAGGQSA